jgi:GAF domain-containing protein
MLKRSRQFFTPPVFEDREKTYRVRVTFNMVLATYAVSLAGLLIALLTNPPAPDKTPYDLILLLASLIVNTGILILVKQGRVQQANFALVAMGTVVIYLIAFNAGGLDRPSIFLNIFILALASILFRGRGVFFTGLVLAIGIGIIYWLEVAFPGSNLNVPAPIFNVAMINIFIILLTGFMLQISSSYLENALLRAQESEKKLLETNSDLENIGKNLEALVAERTASLEHNFQQLEKHTAQLQTITDISQTLVSIQELDQLLPVIVNSITERFGYYHVGLYLKDESGKYVILKAASSEGGQRMLENQQKLRVEPSSLIGFAASGGQSRVVSDVEQDATYLAVPELPETKSEVVLPLQAGTQIIGVLDVQSKQPNAFSEREVNLLNTLANQVAISVQNERLFSETRQALVESEKIYQQYVLLNWEQISRKSANLGYQYLPEGETTPLNEPIQTAETAASGLAEQTSLFIPIKLRGQTIGTMSVKATDLSREWDQDELAMIQATAERVALALETARLLEDSQRRATKERVISDIATKITGAISMDNILKTAVEELGLAIPSAEVVIQFQSPEAEQ